MNNNSCSILIYPVKKKINSTPDCLQHSETIIFQMNKIRGENEKNMKQENKITLECTATTLNSVLNISCTSM